MTVEWGDPESCVEIFEGPDGLVTANRKSIGTLLRDGWWGDAYALMRLQMGNEARKVLRAAGCRFRRSDALMLSSLPDASTDGPEEMRAALEDIDDFLADLTQAPSPKVTSAVSALRQLDWVRSAIEAAPTEEAKAGLERLVLVSSSMGFDVAQAGIEGVMLSVSDLEAVAIPALAARKGRADAARRRNLDKTAWHVPALALAKRHRETYPHRATAQIASVIDNDPSIHSPSPTQVLETLRAWEREGKLPRKKPAGEK